jgi:hypothetical protein
MYFYTQYPNNTMRDSRWDGHRPLKEWQSSYASDGKYYIQSANLDDVGKIVFKNGSRKYEITSHISYINYVQEDAQKFLDMQFQLFSEKNSLLLDNKQILLPIYMNLPHHMIQIFVESPISVLNKKYQYLVEWNNCLIQIQVILQHKINGNYIESLTSHRLIINFLKLLLNQNDKSKSNKLKLLIHCINMILSQEKLIKSMPGHLLLELSLILLQSRDNYCDNYSLIFEASNKVKRKRENIMILLYPRDLAILIESY